jgi:hypothetical protein
VLGRAYRAPWFSYPAGYGRVLRQRGVQGRLRGAAYQGRVERYGWLTGSHMIDGLAPHARPAYHRGGLRGLHRRLNLGSLRPRRPAALGYRRAGVATLLAFLPSARRHPTPNLVPSLDRRRWARVRASGPACPVTLKLQQPQTSAGIGPDGSQVLTLPFRLRDDTIRADGT